jgi:hypothetical protein
MIILLVSFVRDLVYVHVIHDVRTYGEVKKKKGQGIGGQHVPDRHWRHDPFKSVALWPSRKACPGAVRFETNTVRDVLYHNTGLGITIRSFAAHPFVHLAISLRPGPEHAMLQGDMGRSPGVLPVIDNER